MKGLLHKIWRPPCDAVYNQCILMRKIDTKSVLKI